MLVLLLVGCASNTSSARDIRPGAGKDGAGKSEAGPADAIKYKGTFPAGSGYKTSTLTVGGVARKVELYLPSKVAGAPVLITFHGTNDDAKKMIESSAAKNVADKEGAIIVSPWARKLSAGDWDNHTGSETYWETYPNTDPNKNVDLMLVRAMIQEARRAYKADTGRVYVLGHSSGGFFAVLAGLALQDRVAAFVSNSAGLVRCKTTGGCKFTGKGTSCSSLAGQAGYCKCAGASKPVTVPAKGRKVPGFLVHANDDKVVSVYYTCSLAAEMKAKGHPVTVKIENGGGHGMPFPLAQTAWSAISKYRLK